MNIAVAQIDLDALKHNFNQVKTLAPNCPIVAVLKANAYGHGMLRVAEALATEAEAFAVARIDEAQELRQAGFTQRIVLLEGWFENDELPAITKQQIECVVHSQEQLTGLLQAQLPQPLKVWLKVDTGMHRLGFAPERIDEVLHQLRNSRNVHPNITLITHLACADVVNDPQTERQLACFAQVVKGSQCECSVANSAGVVSWAAARTGWLRPGIMLYGVSPMVGQRAQQHGLLPVMTLKTSVIAVRALKQGEPVGYGGTWRSPTDTRLAVVAMGYGDGYPRHAKSGTPVLINGKRYPLVGRVAMDMISVDIGIDDAVNVGDDVVLWGKGLPAEEIAECAETIAYELFCNMTRRVNFQVKR